MTTAAIIVTALVLVILCIPKFAQEWMLHYQQMQTWSRLKETLLGIG